MPYSLTRPIQPAVPPAPSGRAERPLQLLIAAALLLPLTVFLITAWVSYDQHFDAARDRLERTVGMIHEHAIKVFETFAISERYLEELFGGVNDGEIRNNEAYYSSRLRKFIEDLPQLRDLWVIDAKGRPLVAGTVFPMLRDLNLADRDYFQIHTESNVETYVGEMLRSRVANDNFFAITRKRVAAGGRFDGVYLVSISPKYFTSYYSKLSQSDLTVAGLVRADGANLARYPASEPSVLRSRPDSPFMRAIAENPLRGFTSGTSSYDGKERIFAYRKLPSQNVYVYAALDVAAVRDSWLHDMSIHLIFGIPATLTMLGLGILTLRRTRRELVAYARLHEETVRRQTIELALRQAQKMEAVGRLTGGIAHDFNNLLTAIIGNVEMALRRIDAADDRIKRSLNSIRQASMRAATLVQRLLTFSRQHPQEVKAVDINRLVQEMSELMHRTIGETIKVETVLAGGLWKAAIDPNQLENAILNLAVNARDAMPEGGQLTIETSNAYLDEAYVMRAGAEISPGQFVLVAVSDTGTGMSAEVRDKAFEPFFTTKPTGAGSGLGLSMVYGFVKQSDGHLQIYSEPGHGTSIKMYFPRLTDENSIPVWGAIEEPVLTDGGQHHERILLVEDEEDVIRFVAEALAETGYQLVQARTGAEALALLKANPDIDMLFTDVVLPGGMNGRKLANEVLKIKPSLPVLFATGYTRNAIIHHGKLDADVELLTKPFTIEALIRKVRQVLDGADGQRGG